jgi:hypothetical protein
VTIEHKKILRFKAKWLLYVPPGFYILPAERIYVFYMDLRKKLQLFTSLALTDRFDVFSVRYRPNLCVRFRLILGFKLLGGGYSVNNFDDTRDGPNCGQFYKLNGALRFL